MGLLRYMYRLLSSKWYHLRRYVACLGLVDGLRLAFQCEFLGLIVPRYQIRLPQLRDRIGLRGGPASSDADVLFQTFVEGQYDFRIPGRPQRIIDAGANIGMAAAFFASRFPDAKVMAIEPERENYDLLRANTRMYPNVMTKCAALWYEPGVVGILNPNDAAWMYRVGSIEGTTGIPAVTVLNVLEELNWDTVDVLKLDIEGAERDLFIADTSAWLDRIRVIIVECHDQFKPGCSTAVLSKLCLPTWHHSRHNENDVFVHA